MIENMKYYQDVMIQIQKNRQALEELIRHREAKSFIIN